MTETLSLITRAESWHNEVCEDVVKTLETMLERAKTGELQGVAIAATTIDGATVTTYSKMDRTGLLLGALARLQHRIIAAEE